MTRLLSYSEISMAMDCQARHAFAYTGHLTGGQALKSIAITPLLSEGRAWGRGVAALHSAPPEKPGLALSMGMGAVHDSLAEDAQQMKDAGVYDPQIHEERQARLETMLMHYQHSSDPLRLERLEQEIVVPVPSRTGLRGSSIYKFLCRIDGWHVELAPAWDGQPPDNGQPWIVEYKLRSTLTPVRLIELSRQIRWYAWAFRQTTGVDPYGVLVDERWNEIPKPPRLVQDAKRRGAKTPSHARDQLCTEDDYRELCAEYHVEPNEATAEALRTRRWQQRVPIVFRQGELDEAGRDLTSAAKLIRDLDSGELHPVRNAKPSNCRGCRYREICNEPDDPIVDVLYERVVPKRNRELQEAA